VTSLVANAAYNLGVFCNLIPSDIWPDKRGGLLDTPVSSTNKTGCHDITEILLKVALNPITLTLLMMRKGGKWKNTQYQHYRHRKLCLA